MIYTEIRCDGCGKGVSVKRVRGKFFNHIMRRILKDKGWKCSLKGGMDYCPECVAKKGKNHDQGR